MLNRRSAIAAASPFATTFPFALAQTSTTNPPRARQKAASGPARRRRQVHRALAGRWQVRDICSDGQQRRHCEGYSQQARRAWLRSDPEYQARRRRLDSRCDEERQASPPRSEQQRPGQREVDRNDVSDASSIGSSVMLVECLGNAGVTLLLASPGARGRSC